MEGPAYDRVGIDAYLVNTGGTPVTVSSIEFLDLTITYVLAGKETPVISNFDYLGVEGASLLCRFEPATLDPHGMPTAFALMTKRMRWADGTLLISFPAQQAVSARVRITFFDRAPEILDVPVTTYDPQVKSLEASITDDYQACWRNEETDIDLTLPDALRHSA